MLSWMSHTHTCFQFHFNLYWGIWQGNTLAPVLFLFSLFSAEHCIHKRKSFTNVFILPFYRTLVNVCVSFCVYLCNGLRQLLFQWNNCTKFQTKLIWVWVWASCCAMTPDLSKENQCYERYVFFLRFQITRSNTWPKKNGQSFSWLQMTNSRFLQEFVRVCMA